MSKQYNCPNCGAVKTGAAVCEYCGTIFDVKNTIKLQNANDYKIDININGKLLKTYLANVEIINHYLYETPLHRDVNGCLIRESNGKPKREINLKLIEF